MNLDEFNSDPIAFLKESFRQAVKTADPIEIVPSYLPKLPNGKIMVVGAGKAAASMAFAVEKEWRNKIQLEGLVVTRYAHGLPLKKIRCIEAGHPVPDLAGETAAQEIYQAVKKLTADDLLLVLISGGGSSLLSLPVEGVSNHDLKQVTKELLNSGAPITDINIVRKHLSRIQGGKLSLLSKAPVTALIISDVVGDDPTDIASGPCVADPSTYRDALDVINRWSVDAPTSVSSHLEKGLKGMVEETPKPGDPRLKHSSNYVISTARESLLAASNLAKKIGLTTISLGDAITGEARDVGEVMAGWTRELVLNPDPMFQLPLLLLSGGECTVTVKGNGRGGRCAEFLLSTALRVEALGIHKRVYGLAADTDGIDGVSPHAGVYFDPKSILTIRSQGIDPRALLDNNDALGVFEPLKNIITTGPTRTNVNDFRALLVI
ncbi:MAG: glycerate kinase [Betaproteobacteria bacterium TMED41]|nr:MAG: glycerate kinase [Betaproteobacteria bacterium TMED41]